MIQVVLDGWGQCVIVWGFRIANCPVGRLTTTLPHLANLQMAVTTCSAKKTSSASKKKSLITPFRLRSGKARKQKASDAILALLGCGPDVPARTRSKLQDTAQRATAFLEEEIPWLQ